MFWKGVPYQVFRKVLEGAILNFVSSKIFLKEFKYRLLMKFKLPPVKVKEFSEVIVFNSQIVYSKKKLNIVKKDFSDNKIFECVLETKISFVTSGMKTF